MRRNPVMGTAAFPKLVMNASSLGFINGREQGNFEDGLDVV